MSDNIVSVTLNGVWHTFGHIEIGTVIDCNSEGWGKAVRHTYSARTSDSEPKPITILIGARIATAETERFEVDGEWLEQRSPNWMIEDRFLQAAVDHMDVSVYAETLPWAVNSKETP